jgi:hypothetical protein
MSSRRLDLPPQYEPDGSAFIHVDQDRSLGTPDKDGPVITDPTQAILVIKLTKRRRRCFARGADTTIDRMRVFNADGWKHTLG